MANRRGSEIITGDSCLVVRLCRRARVNFVAHKCLELLIDRVQVVVTVHVSDVSRGSPPPGVYCEVACVAVRTHPLSADLSSFPSRLVWIIHRKKDEVVHCLAWRQRSCIPMRTACSDDTLQAPVVLMWIRSSLARYLTREMIMVSQVLVGKCVRVCVCVSVFVRLHITAQFGFLS